MVVAKQAPTKTPPSSSPSVCLAAVHGSAALPFVIPRVCNFIGEFSHTRESWIYLSKSADAKKLIWRRSKSVAFLGLIRGLSGEDRRRLRIGLPYRSWGRRITFLPLALTKNIAFSLRKRFFSKVIVPAEQKVFSRRSEGEAQRIAASLFSTIVKGCQQESRSDQHRGV